jgi:hypothetical protein
MPRSTVSAVLWREGLGKRSRLAPVEPPNRYERGAAGEPIHVDIKKLGRIVVPGHAVTSNRRKGPQRRRVPAPRAGVLAAHGITVIRVTTDG